jgi:hypothetical protein
VARSRERAAAVPLAKGRCRSQLDSSYSDRRHRGAPISSSIAESAVSELVSRRFGKKRKMLVRDYDKAVANGRRASRVHRGGWQTLPLVEATVVDRFHTAFQLQSKWGICGSRLCRALAVTQVLAPSSGL